MHILVIESKGKSLNCWFNEKKKKIEKLMYSSAIFDLHEFECQSLPLNIFVGVVYQISALICILGMFL